MSQVRHGPLTAETSRVCQECENFFRRLAGPGAQSRQHVGGGSFRGFVRHSTNLDSKPINFGANWPIGLTPELLDDLFLGLGH